MICPTCNYETSSLKILVDGTQGCPNCLGFAETSGSMVDNSITRNSFRVREQQQNYEGDMLPPHRYNRQTRRAEPDPEFIKRFPDKASVHYTPEELQKAKMPVLAEKVNDEQAKPKKPDPSVKFRGNTKEGIKRVLKDV